MATTVIEALLVTLGLDPSQYIRGVQQHRNSQNQLVNNTRGGNSEINRIERQTADAQRKRAQEMEARNKAIAAGITSLRNQALSLFAVFTAGRGIKDFIVDTINSAANLGLLAENLGITTETLSAWQRANERAGGSAAGMTAQFKEAADAIAKYKLGQGLSAGMIAFGQYGGDVSVLQTAEDFIKARADLLTKVYAKDPTKAVSLAAQMGINDDTFNLIKQGTPAMLALVDAQRKNSVISEANAKQARELRNQWLDFSQTLEASAVKVLVALIPAFSKLAAWLVQLADRIGDNKDAIAQWVTNALDKVLPLLAQLAAFIQNGDWSGANSGLAEFAKSVKSISESMREAISLYDRMTNGGKEKLIPSTVAGVQAKLNRIDVGKAGPVTKADPNDYFPGIADSAKLAVMRTLASIGNKSAAQYVYDKTGKDDYPAARAGAFSDQPSTAAIDGKSVPDKLMKMGWTQAQAAGITGSLDQESKLDPAARNPKSGAYGIAQWLAPRRADFKTWAGHDIEGTGLDEQLRFMHYEMTQGKEKAGGDKIRATTTAAEAAIAHRKYYERPGLDEARDDNRAGLATALDAAMRARNAKAAGGMPAAAGAATSTPRAAPAATSSSTTDVKVGAINIHTQATDAAGIARSISGAVENYGFIAQADSGMA